jgi:hypothetical protein
VGVGSTFRVWVAWVASRTVVRLTNYCAVKSVGWQLRLVKPRRFPLPLPAVLVNDTGVRVPNALGGRS